MVQNWVFKHSLAREYRWTGYFSGWTGRNPSSNT